MQPSWSDLEEKVQYHFHIAVHSLAEIKRIEKEIALNNSMKTNVFRKK